MMGKVEKRGQVFTASIRMTRVGKSGVGIPQLIEKGVHHGINRRQTLCRCVLQQP